jgi:phosphoribosylformimino-5-aminoimidazole carboxamide ribonucleotide (ProFAR) isomerase
VQLVHGRKRALAVDDVMGQLEKFRGYSWLHVIDLDAAMSKGDNSVLVRDLIAGARTKYEMKVRVGGGIRTIARARAILRYGADQIIIGSAALKNGGVNARYLERLRKLAGRERIVIALDTAKGRIVIHGWRTSTSLRPADVMPQMAPYCAAFLCTDVDREGTMRGGNLRWFRELHDATDLPIIAAGGIRSRREIRALARLGMDAAVGMALYTNRLR